MPKFNKGDKVLYHNRIAEIVDVHSHLPTNKGLKKMIWYSVKYEGMHSCYAVSQKSNILRKVVA
jgi:hypothetical protein